MKRMMVQTLHPAAKPRMDYCDRCRSAQSACFHDNDVVWAPVKTPPGTWELIRFLSEEQLGLLARWANNWEKGRPR